MDHALKDMYMLHYGVINSMNSLYYNCIEMVIDVINSVITLHVFHKQFHFLLQPQVT